MLEPLKRGHPENWALILTRCIIRIVVVYPISVSMQGTFLIRTLKNVHIWRSDCTKVLIKNCSHAD